MFTSKDTHTLAASNAALTIIENFKPSPEQLKELSSLFESSSLSSKNFSKSSSHEIIAETPKDC